MNYKTNDGTKIQAVLKEKILNRFDLNLLVILCLNNQIFYETIQLFNQAEPFYTQMSNILTMGDDFLFFNDSKPLNEEIQSLYCIDSYQNPSEPEIMKLEDHIESQHQHQNPQIQRDMQSFEEQTASSSQSLKIFVKKAENSKCHRGSQNSIPSNLVREFIHSIRLQLQSIEEPLKRINKFIKQKQIKSQRWAIDALLLILIFQRDQMGSISQQQFKRVRIHFLEKLISKKERTNIQKSKQMFEIYINHVKKYEETQFGVESIKFIEQDSKLLFSSIVFKRKKQVENYLQVLKILHKNLEKKTLNLNCDESQEICSSRDKNSSKKKEQSKGASR